MRLVGIIDALSDYNLLDIYPMHMPGHKRNIGLVSMPNPYGIDVTELGNFDDLHDAAGMLSDAMKKAANLFGSSNSYYLINGSTCGILAGISACAREGSRVLMARNCHKSVYNAVSLARLNTEYIIPSADESFGIPASISPALVEKALNKHDDIGIIIITSPTYEGIVSDIRQIAEIAHSKGVPFLVDESHGSHFGFSPAFPKNSVSAGADLVVHGLHKTLPSLTQTAIMHVNGDLVHPEEVRRCLAVFETSSPSYILMASISSCIDLIINRGADLFEQYEKQLRSFSEWMRSLRNFRVFCKGTDSIDNHPNVFAFDPGKLLISTKNTGVTGAYLSEQIQKTFKVQLEMAMGDYALAMTGIADTPEGFNRLGKALLETDSIVTQDAGPSYPLAIPLPRIQMSLSGAIAAAGKFVSLSNSEGGVSREFVYAYPPGVPIITPGEILSSEIINNLETAASDKAVLKSTYGRIPLEINLVV